MLTAGIRTAAAPYLPGWMHQRRYCYRVLLRCPSAAVACAGAIASATVRHVAGRGARRKTDEGDRRAPTRGTTLLFCRSGAEAKIIG